MFQVEGAVAIDDEAPDGFLKTTLARYRQIAPQRTSVHQKQGGAVAQCLNTNGEATIIGHGRVGIICTGSGKFLNQDPMELIDDNNIGAWMPSNMTRLTLLGCNTGEGKKGADLVSKIAVATGATVRAPWGYVYIGNDCPDLYLEEEHGLHRRHADLQAIAGVRFTARAVPVRCSHVEVRRDLRPG